MQHLLSRHSRCEHEVEDRYPVFFSFSGIYAANPIFQSGYGGAVGTDGFFFDLGSENFCPCAPVKPRPEGPSGLLAAFTQIPDAVSAKPLGMKALATCIAKNFGPGFDSKNAMLRL
jgi:hypothetical protein